MTDAVVIGGGHNGLAAAFYLAKAGLRPLVLERRHEVGGGAITRELHPGFLCPALSHEVLLHRQIAHDMDLARYGAEFLAPDVRVYGPSLTGPPLVIYDDAARAAESISRTSAKDASAYTAFRTWIAGAVPVLESAFTAPPPRIDEPSAADLWNLLKAGKRFRALERRDAYRLLRWLPMPVGDVMHECFESELLCAALAAPGVSGTMLGPWSAGSALVMLAREAHASLAGGSGLRVRGGPGALTRAMASAAAAAGATIQTDCAIERILVRDERVTGVVAAGREIPASVVVSAVDPKTTWLGLVDAADLPPDFAAKMRNYRASGTVAKLNLALSALPSFRGLDDPAVAAGRIHIGPELDYLERAFDHVKYGEFSRDPWLDITIPSILDAQLAPKGAHVASIYVHCAPHALRGGRWNDWRDALLAAVMRVLGEYAPGIASLVVAAELITPDMLASEYGLAGGHIFHGELAPDQLFAMRPVLGHARYDGPVRGLYLCSGGTHPGGFLTGMSGRLAAAEVARRTNG